MISVLLHLLYRLGPSSKQKVRVSWASSSKNSLAKASHLEVRVRSGTRESAILPEVVAVVRPLLQPLVHLEDLVVRLQEWHRPALHEMRGPVHRPMGTHGTVGGTKPGTVGPEAMWAPRGSRSKELVRWAVGSRGATVRWGSAGAVRTPRTEGEGRP